MYFNQKFYSDFDISPKYGFLSDPNIFSDKLPLGFEEYEDICKNLNNNCTEFRNIVDKIVANKPQKFYNQLTENLTYLQKKQIYTLFTFIVQKYVKCDHDNIIDTIPYEIGIVWYNCAQSLKLPNVATYSALVLNNCVIKNDGKLEPYFNITGTNDEKHFYKIHIEIESMGSDLLYKMYNFHSRLLDECSEFDDLNDQMQRKEILLDVLSDVAKTIGKMTNILNNMYSNCKPDVFWNIVRKYLSGYTEKDFMPNGLKINNTDIEPFKFVGGSAAQSTLIQAIDIFLGIEHTSPHGKLFLIEQQKYMPEKHLNYLKHLTILFKISIKDIVSSLNDDEVTHFYNYTIDQLVKFRNSHYTIVHKYLVKHSQSKNPEGTGTLQVTELKNIINDTVNSKLRNYNDYIILVILCIFYFFMNF